MLDIIRDRAQSWGVKIIFGIIILVFVFWGIGSFNAQSPDVVVNVNGKNITRKDFSFEYESYVTASKMRMPNIPDEFFQSREQIERVIFFMVDKELLAQAAKNMGMTVSTAEVQREILEMPRFKDASGQFSLEAYDAILNRRGMKKTEFEEEVRKLLLISKLQNVIMSAADLSEAEALANFRHLQETRKIDYVFFASADFAKQAEISDAQIAEYYEVNKTLFTVPRHINVEYLAINPQTLAGRYDIEENQVQAFYDANKDRFIEAPQVKIRHILFVIPNGASEADVAAINGNAEAVYQQASRGADFAELARNNSDDPSAANGGDMGWIRLNELVPTFADQLKDLKAGGVTKPFASNMGFHVMKVEERRDERQLPFAEVRDQIELQMAAEKGAEDMSYVLDQVVGEILNGKDLALIARELGLATTAVENLKREDVARELAIGPESVESLFLTPAGITLDRPIAAGSGYMFAKVTQVQEEHVAPQEDVQEHIIAVLKADEARAMGSRKADEAVEALRAGSALPDDAQLKVSEFFNRQFGPEEIGPAPEFLAAVFDQKSRDEWMGPYVTSRGSVIARLKEVEHPSDEDWQRVKELMMMQMGMIKQEGILEAYMADLHAKADISNYNLDSIQFDK